MTKIKTKQSRGVCALGYLSPEWCLYIRRKVEPSRDVWAFGCMIYHILNGRCLFNKGDGDVDKKLETMLALHREYENNGEKWIRKYGEPERNPENRWKQTPEDLNELVEHCLIINPKKRATMDEIVQWSGELLIKRGVSGSL